MTDRELVRIHVETLFVHNARGRMLRVNEPERRPAPRFYLARHAQGNEWRFRDDLDENLIHALESACRDEPYGDAFLQSAPDPARFEAILVRSEPIQRTWAGPAYRFPLALPESTGAVLIDESNSHLLGHHLSAWLEDTQRCQPFVACLHDGRAVSLCCSGRTTAQAHEAAVETAEDFRGRGYATRAVAAWANAVRGIGCIPLYSTSWANMGSRALAARLGLICYASDLHFT